MSEMSNVVFKEMVNNELYALKNIIDNHIYSEIEINEMVRVLPFINIYIGENSKLNVDYSKIINNLAILKQYYFYGFNNSELYEGLAFIIYSTKYLYKVSYNSIIEELLDIVIDVIPEYMSSLNNCPSIYECNLYNGLSGVGLALLEHSEYEAAEEGIHEIIEYIVIMIKKLKRDRKGIYKDRIKIEDINVIEGITGPILFLIRSFEKGFLDKEHISIIEEVIYRLININNTKQIQYNGSYKNYSSELLGVINVIYLSGIVISNDKFKSYASEWIEHWSKEVIDDEFISRLFTKPSYYNSIQLISDNIKRGNEEELINMLKIQNEKLVSKIEEVNLNNYYKNKLDQNISMYFILKNYE